MEIFGIGLQELVFVLIIALIVLGPRDMQKAAMTIAKWVRSILMSDAWMATQQITREAKKQWMHFVREANDDLNKIRKETDLAENLKNHPSKNRHKNPARSVPIETAASTPSPSSKVYPSENPEVSPQSPTVESSEADPEKHD